MCRKDSVQEPRWRCRVPSEPVLEMDKPCSLSLGPEARLGHQLRHFLLSSVCTWGEGRATAMGQARGLGPPAGPRGRPCCPHTLSAWQDGARGGQGRGGEGASQGRGLGPGGCPGGTRTAPQNASWTDRPGLGARVASACTAAGGSPARARAEGPPPASQPPPSAQGASGPTALHPEGSASTEGDRARARGAGAGDVPGDLAGRAPPELPLPMPGGHRALGTRGKSIWAAGQDGP